MPSTATSVRAWRAQNPERARLIAKRYRDKHKAEINERRRARSRDASPRTRSYTPEQKRNYQLANREYYRRNAEAINQKRRQRYAGDPDCKAKRKCSDKEYGAKNQHKKHSYNRKYYQENKARVLQSVHAYYREHRERTIAKKREWSAANRSRSRKIGRDKDARKMGALGSHTFGQWMARVEFYGSRCVFTVAR
jgi:hypothetical protein